MQMKKLGLQSFSYDDAAQIANQRTTNASATRTGVEHLHLCPVKGLIVHFNVEDI
jgi:hypothetical protein